MGHGTLTFIFLHIFSTDRKQAVFLAVAAIGFHWIPVSHNLALETNDIGWPAYLLLASMIIFVVFYSLGIGNLAWVSSEFFPTEIRALGTMMVRYYAAPNDLVCY